MNRPQRFIILLLILACSASHHVLSPLTAGLSSADTRFCCGQADDQTGQTVLEDGRAQIGEAIRSDLDSTVRLLTERLQSQGALCESPGSTLSTQLFPVPVWHPDLTSTSPTLQGQKVRWQV